MKKKQSEEIEKRICDLEIEKMVKAGRTLVFDTPEEAKLMADRMKSYYYPIACTYLNGKDAGCIWGVPK